METTEDLMPLSNQQIEERLAGFDGWQFQDDKISKTFTFDSFSDGVNLISLLAPFCDKIDHHLDILINYKKIKFELTRYSIGNKVTDRDFTVANKIEELYNDYLKS